MTTIELLSRIMEICVFPLLALLTTYVVQIIRAKMGEISNRQENALAQKYLDMLTDTITNCVIAVNQTYVDALKKRGEFGADAQKEAFERVYKQVMANLTLEARSYLGEIYGDLDEFIKILIEAKVHENKTSVTE